MFFFCKIRNLSYFISIFSIILILLITLITISSMNICGFLFFSRLSSNHFTCVQRCTCCFVLLFTGMLLDILYYDQMKEGRNNAKLNGLSIGPFYFSREQVCCCTCISRMFLFFIIFNQIAIGIMSDIILFVLSLFLVMFFRRIQRRQSLVQVSPILRALTQLRPMEIVTISDAERGKKRRI